MPKVREARFRPKEVRTRPMVTFTLGKGAKAELEWISAETMIPQSRLLDHLIFKLAEELRAGKKPMGIKAL